MLGKLFQTVLLLLCLPALAHAWTVTAKIGSGAGTLVSDTNKTITSGTGYITVPSTTESVTITVKPRVGFYVSMVVLDGVKVTKTGSGDLSYTIARGTTNHLFTAYFTPTVYFVNLTSAKGGVLTAQRVAPVPSTVSRTGLSGLSYGAEVEIAATPNSDYLVTGIYSDGTRVYTGSSYTVQKHRFTVTGNSRFSATYELLRQVTPRIAASLVRCAVNQAIELNSSKSSSNDAPISYSYSVASGDARKVTLTPVGDGSRATFQASAPGEYTVRVTATTSHGVSASVVSTPITVINPGNFNSQLCTACHGPRNAQITNSYLASEHANGAIAVTCSDCHNYTGTDPHPHVRAPIDACKGCHTSFATNVFGHQSKVGTNTCTTCHDPHSVFPSRFSGLMPPHFNTVTSAGYPASYGSSRAHCSDCHSPTNDGTALDVIRHDWAASGHGAVSDAAWSLLDFKTLDGCVRCHTRTGFLAYSSGKVTSAWGVASDKTKEVLACNGCHSDIDTGMLRSVAPTAPYGTDAAANPDFGPSNLCISCHSGTTSGGRIKALLSEGNDFGNLPFVDPHYSAAGGVLCGSVGYHFSGALYASYSSHTHRVVGTGNYRETGRSGPCIACHKSSSYGHSFATGALPVCSECHVGLTDASIAASRASFQNLLTVLKAELAARGIGYLETWPHFSVTNWGAGQAGADRMGAAFNYALLVKEPGAFAHNPSYAKKLVVDSIDILDNGALDDSVASAALPALRNSGAITADTMKQAAAYLATSSCLSCHAGTATSFTGARGVEKAPHFASYTGSYAGSLAKGARNGCASCHVPGSGANREARLDWAGSGHGDVQDVPWKGDNFAARGSERGEACVRCHSTTGYLNFVKNGGLSSYADPADPTREVLRCNACHNPDYSRRVLLPFSSSRAHSVKIAAASSVSAPVKSSDLGISNICVPCHSGTTSGELVKRAFAFTGFSSAGRLINHFLVGGGILDNTIGYEYQGTPAGTEIDYNKQNTWHAGIGLPESKGVTGSAGPCVTCHMPAGEAHGFRALTRDSSGAVASVPAKSVCDRCHPSYLGGGHNMDPETIRSVQGDFASALEVLKAELVLKGYDPDKGVPRNWGGSAEERANNFGAYYNYLLLRDSDAGSYVHNPTYSKRLIQYSLDWLDDQSFDDSVYAAMSELLGAGRISQAVYDGGGRYLGVAPGAMSGSCVLCHRDYYN
ncbi:hypothetical protein LPW11_20930 [Geomonas sp. RF6]|uniref:hypothetical protein n=1 Tax=Geomonas sp. RF6 TaxID=2897342 RepID=UPI001E65332D|nr:hypothetical protein [Geomonas sp. RF6]UFS70326.1 hypothetical protein LPW11_20930 [Geomonas sp. RF6]